ncbi:glucose PTS transporter subunit IIA [Floccifex sp.]|uniref:glucose PTS transporter subunit IIA n=1 Tax=Floccifex sp. TaxID=2815810 RepID=UPI0029FED3F7|nr:glucose PTS transporter subunit IIA [Floccifex sp.]MDD7281059.1 glucose PTS transporter subunit IIA [Erysipelotrichaceae bacterium]MDY2957357.1 glucose PTS transporter subunit IIA [Floccifex sp.]
MKKYKDLAADIIANVGGKENVDSLRHCVTRLRFKLKDESKANDEAIKNLKGTIGLVKAAGEYMVVIGEHVGDVYDEVCEQLGINNDMTKAVETNEKKSILDKALGLIKSGLGPTLNIMCAAGILKGVLVILQMCGLPSDGGICMLVNAAGDAFFYCLPIVMGFNIARYLGIDPYFGLIFGACMIYPSIQNVDVTVFGYTANVSYTSSFLPVMFGLLLAAPLYKFFKKHLPKLINGFMTPMLTLIIAFPITFMVIGPIANVLSGFMATAINWIFEFSPLIGCSILGGIWQILVMFGIHGLIVMFAFYAVMSGTPSLMLGATWTVCFGIVGILVAAFIKTKDKDVKENALPAAASAIFGVTEPGMYGIIIPRKVLLGISCISGACAGFVIGLFDMKIYTYAGMGLIGLLSFLNPENPQILPIVIAVIVPLVVGFLLTFFFYKDGEVETKPVEKKDNKINVVNMPVSGTVKDIKESSDPAFSSEALGHGIVIIPDDGEIVSPVNGTIKTLFPTKHAIGIVSEDGIEVLIHIGIDTVNLQGKHFTSYVKQDDVVKAGDKLVSFDKEAIEQEGYNTEIPVVITNTKEYLDVVILQTGHVEKNTEIIKGIRSEVQ